MQIFKCDAENVWNTDDWKSDSCKKNLAKDSKPR